MALFRRRERSAEQAAEKLGEFVIEPARASFSQYRDWPQPKFADLPLGRAFEGRSDEELRAGALVLLDMALAAASGRNWPRLSIIGPALSALGRRKLRWTQDEAKEVLRLATSAKDAFYFHDRTAGFVASVLERAGGAPDPKAVDAYVKLLTSSMSPSGSAKFLTRLRPFTSEVGGTVDLRVVSDGDDWGRAVRGLLEGLDDPTGIDGALRHLAASSTRPSKKWLTKAEQLLAAAPAAPALLREMLTLVLSTDLQRGPHEWSGSFMFTGANADLARGAAFGVALSDPGAAALLADVAVYTGTSGGASAVARDEKTANGCVAALGLMKADDAVSALVRVQQKVKNRTVRKQIDRSLQEAAAAAGMGVDEMVERAVPTHGLGPGGFREEHLGEHVVRLAVEDDKVRLLVAKPKGGWASTVPARLRDEHGGMIADLRTAAKEATKTLAAERLRIESLLASERSWPHNEWVQLYRDHPITGHWTRQLLWELAVGDTWRTARVDGDGLVDVDGAAVVPDDDSVVRLWHPLRSTPEEVQRWRTALAEAERRQPFKQAWREVYLLTPAEEQTETYSNRFAAHILRYPQAFALMKGRDWAAQALGYWDGGFDGEATKVFPGGRWRASFFYDLVEEEADGYGTPSLCSTDQVRFHELVGGLWEQAPLVTVPPLVFSEAMRDVDLFVGVASIAADPTWVDRGTDRHYAYWQRTSFGDLTESAETRKAALERLMPRTKIADKVAIEGKFLRVRGYRRTYKIHIGSGNILMEPNDVYLCIVPTRDKSSDRIFLPFEEDGGRLSLIVSKAFLLADDDKITDTTILRQIGV